MDVEITTPTQMQNMNFKQIDPNIINRFFLFCLSCILVDDKN